MWMTKWAQQTNPPLASAAEDTFHEAAPVSSANTDLVSSKLWNEQEPGETEAKVRQIRG